MKVGTVVPNSERQPISRDEKLSWAVVEAAAWIGSRALRELNAGEALVGAEERDAGAGLSTLAPSSKDFAIRELRRPGERVDR